jgi:hypothetical protein
MRAAVLDKLGREQVSVTLPEGALLRESSERSTTPPGMVGVYWEDRHFSVFLWDLLENADMIRSA